MSENAAPPEAEGPYHALPDIRQVLDLARDGMLVIDDSGRIVLANPAAEELLGYGRADLMGMSVEALAASATVARRAELDEWLQPGRTPEWVRDVRARHADGREVPVDLSLAAMPHGGRLWVVATIVDARHPGEEQVRYAEQMHAVGRLAGSFAHDFNNILASILGSAELALESGVDPDVEGDLEMIVSSAKRGRGIVERLLGFSQRRSLDRQSYPFSEILQRADRLLRERLPPGIDLQISSACDARVLADVSAMHQLLLNLVLNAAHEMPSGGSIRVSCCLPSPSTLTERLETPPVDRPYVELTVRDTGPGRVAQALDAVLTGHGARGHAPSIDAMGLAVAFAIAEDHGGVIDVRRVPGEGTTVRCLFPVHGPRAQGAG